MGRLRTETIKIAPELLHRTPASAELTPAILEDYSTRMRAQRRREDSMRSCEKVLRQFYDFLPESKLVTRDTLQKWREHLLSENYAIRTVNSKVSMVNALLESMDCRDFQVTRQLLTEAFEAPELTRQEYVRMLQTARTLEDERAYVLTKLFATTGIAVMDIPSVTVEAVQVGQVVIKSGKETEIIRFPASLRADLLRYSAENGRTSGMIFVKKNGTPLARTQISLYIQKLAEAARVPAEKGNIRALRQLYKSTVSSIEANFDLLVRQAYEHQLETEQLRVGWEIST